MSAVLVGATAPSGVAAATSDWPQLQGGPQRTGVARGDVALTAKHLPLLAPSWHTQLFYGNASTPIIVNDTVYQAGGDTGKDVTAYDLATGAVRWQTELPGWVENAAPAVSNGVLVAVDLAKRQAAPGARFKWFTDITGVDARTGDVLWTRALLGGNAGGWTTTARGDWVYAVVANAYVWRLNIHTGHVSFKVAVHPISGVALDGNVAAVVTQGNGMNLTALDATTGATMWTRPMGPVTGCGAYEVTDPAAVGGTIYAGDCSNGDVYAFDEATGTELWHSTAAQVWWPLTVTDTLVLIQQDRGVVALDRVTGAIAWTYSQASYLTSATSCVVNGTVVVGVGDGLLFLRLGSGRPFGKLGLGGGASYFAIGQNHIAATVDTSGDESYGQLVTMHLPT
jgi:outer membrane protein assembly factor BamB